MPSKTAAPTKLGTKARALWTKVTGTYELRPDEMRVLEDACREIDLIERLEDELQGLPLLVRGSMGQQVINPMVSELRQHRATLRTLLAGLSLPDEPGGTAQGAAGARSANARKAAEARWRRGA